MVKKGIVIGVAVLVLVGLLFGREGASRLRRAHEAFLLTWM